MPGAHAYLSPSAAHRWIACPGSARLSANALPTGSLAARQGSAAHYLLERALMNGEAPEGREGHTVNVEDETGAIARVPVTPDMIAIVRTALDWVHTHKGRHLKAEQILPTFAAFPGIAEDVIWGTADVVTWNDHRHALIADLKAGIHAVDVMGNHQLTLYAIGLQAQTGWAFDKITVAIVQPRVGEPVTCTFTREELEERIPFYADAIARATAPHTPLFPSEGACHYCPAAPTCPAAHEFTLALARKEFGAPDLLAPTDMAFILDKAPLIRSLLDAVEAHAVQLLQLGRPVPGFKLVQGRKNRIWKDEGEAMKVLASLGYDADSYAPRKLVTPAGAEKLVKNKSVLAPLVETPEGGPKLARAEDPRTPLLSDFAGGTTEK